MQAEQTLSRHKGRGRAGDAGVGIGMGIKAVAAATGMSELIIQKSVYRKGPLDFPDDAAG